LSNQHIFAQIEVSAVSDIGTVRKVNEDQFALIAVGAKQLFDNQYFGPIDEVGFLLFVSDGSGGDGRGRIASSLAREIFQQTLLEENTEQPIGERLIQAAVAANNHIWKEAHTNSKLAGMAATLTAAWIVPPIVYIVEVGDSRCYLVRNNQIRQITRDQSMVQTLIDSGVLTPQMASSHPYRNIVLQSLGAQAELIPVVTTFELAQDDRLLVCSDGLNKNLTEEQILTAMRQTPNCLEASQALIDLANSCVADDNVTVITARVAGGKFPAVAALVSYISEASEELTRTNDLVDLTELLAPIETSTSNLTNDLE
jgi:PPM family protein phosphatase